jgi:signal transduction histidine kinase/CheY-like chemotaxis protein
VGSAKKGSQPNAKHRGPPPLRRRKASPKGAKVGPIPRSSRTANRAGANANSQHWAALQEVSTPFALVEGRRIAVSNRGFEELSRTSPDASWRREDAKSAKTDRPCRGLSRLLVSEVASLNAVQPAAPVTRLYRRVGRDEYVEASYWLSPGPGSQRRAVVMIREATALVQAVHEADRLREALLQNERMRAIGELASGVAHDLNNTLHAMNLRLSLIEQSDVCRTAQESNISALSRAVNDAALVVGRLQDFARQKPDRSPECIEISAVVGEAIDMVRTTIEGESSLDGTPVRIRTNLPTLPHITALASEVRHVVVNLLLNARDALPKGGTIHVVGSIRDECVVLEVLDDGCGIPEQDLENIFCPFFTTKGTLGTGLGLFNARARLGRLGGQISASNRPEGGACFTLSFPIAPPVPAPVPKRSATHVPRGHRILVIDDDFDNLQATKLVMALHGQLADTAQTGTEAIGRVSSGGRYDLVFCDLGMPDMSGWRIAREIQRLSPGTVVYMLTGWAQTIEKDDPRRRWVKDVLQKPMKPETLRDLLVNELVEDRDATPGSPPAHDIV